MLNPCQCWADTLLLLLATKPEQKSVPVKLVALHHHRKISMIVYSIKDAPDG